MASVSFIRVLEGVLAPCKLHLQCMWVYFYTHTYLYVYFKWSYKIMSPCAFVKHLLCYLTLFPSYVSALPSVYSL